MSPPVISILKTSYEIMELFEEIHRKGNTVIIVTHEEDIARYAHRIIRIRDGIIERDEINEKQAETQPNLGRVLV
jgi:putative ABC transport system ATP-binding protein